MVFIDQNKKFDRNFTKPYSNNIRKTKIANIIIISSTITFANSYKLHSNKNNLKDIKQ